MMHTDDYPWLLPLSKTILKIATYTTIACVAAVLFQRCQLGVACAFPRRKEAVSHSSEAFYTSGGYL